MYCWKGFGAVVCDEDSGSQSTTGGFDLEVCLFQ